MDNNFFNNLNSLLWWIPFKKLRVIIKETILCLFEIREQNRFIIERLNYISNDNDLGYVIVSISGGFTDQIRHYNLAYSIEKIFNRKIKYDISWYKDCGMDLMEINKRNFELSNIFKDIQFDIATEEEILIARKYCQIKYTNNIRNILKTKRIVYIEANIWNFDGLGTETDGLLDITKVLDLDKYIFPLLNENNKNIYYDIINNDFSIACHVRRTDYSMMKDVNIDNDNYFKNAIDLISKKLNKKKELKVYFFSDDIKWVKNKIIPLIEKDYNYFIVEENNNEKGYIDFYLISLCKYHISSAGNFCLFAHNFSKFENKILITQNDFK